MVRGAFLTDSVRSSSETPLSLPSTAFPLRCFTTTSLLSDPTALSADQSLFAPVPWATNVADDNRNEATRTRLIENLFLPVHIRFPPRFRFLSTNASFP